MCSERRYRAKVCFQEAVLVTVEWVGGSPSPAYIHDLGADTERRNPERPHRNPRRYIWDFLAAISNLSPIHPNQSPLQSRTRSLSSLRSIPIHQHRYSLTSLLQMPPMTSFLSTL